MKPTVILLIRHGEVANPEEVVYGRLPGFPLNEEGRRQIRAVAARLAEEPLEAIYTSPMLRARQTAEILARRHPGAPLVESDLLAEVRTSWEGEPLSRVPPPFNYYEPPRHPDDEAPEQLLERMRRFTEEVRHRHPGGTVAAVSHGDPLAALRVGLEGRKPCLATLRGPDYPPKASLLRVVLGDEVRVSYEPPPAG